MGDDDRQAELADALRRAGDLDRQLEGEDPRTEYVDDAEHWERVYGELCGFKEQVILTAEASGGAVGPDGQPEVGNDLTILRTELERLRRRFEFWASRRRALQSSSGGAQ